MNALRSATLICSAILLSGCSLRGQTGEFEARVEHFHQLFNDENVDGLVALTAPEFRRITDSESFASLMRSLRERLGNAELSQLKDWNIGHLRERSVTLVYQTQFERGEATEMFTFDYSEPPRLISYNVTVSAVRPR